MGYPIPEVDIAGKQQYEWEDEDGCRHCGHGLMWGNTEGRCTYVEDGKRCACSHHEQ